MSVSTLAHPPHHRAALTKFWIAVLLLTAIGVAIAWLGAGSMRGDTLASGVFIRTVEAGTGTPVNSDDGVYLEYEGRLADGTVFDSSAGRGPVPLLAGQTIPGFAEALTQMREGGTYHVKIPSEHAYGATPPPGLPPNADLEFDVTVVQVVPNAASQMPQAPPEAQPQAPPDSGQQP